MESVVGTEKGLQLYQVNSLLRHYLYNLGLSDILVDIFANPCNCIIANKAESIRILFILLLVSHGFDDIVVIWLVGVFYYTFVKLRLRYCGIER